MQLKTRLQSEWPKGGWRRRHRNTETDTLTHIYIHRLSEFSRSHSGTAEENANYTFF